MSSIVLNSESKLSQCTNNQNMETDNLSEDGLFNSLFVIISQENEDVLLLENNSSKDQEDIVSDSFYIENQENKNELFSVINENNFLKDFKKFSNFTKDKKDFFPKKNLSFENNPFEVNLEILNTKFKKEFSKNFSDVVKKINDKSLVKNINISSNEQNKEFIDFVYKKNDNLVVNIKENLESFSSNRLKFYELKSGFDVVVTNKVDEDLLLENNNKKYLNNSTNIFNIFKNIKSIKNQNLLKSDNTNYHSQINTITSSTNITNHFSGNYFSGSNFNGSNSFYSGTGNSLEYLNMLDKSWSNSLLNRIEKSIKNGDETLVISLKPRNLGKLKISLTLNNDSTRINIITENSSAALLLSEAESKLSQMLENTGLKLSNLSTSSDQGKRHNPKNGNQDNNEKKMLAKDELSLEKGNQLVSKMNSENQILNLLA